MTSSLHGLGVLVTRPEHQAEPLCQLIEHHGGTAIRCPALSIQEPHDWNLALTAFGRLAHYRLAIFTSPNAVERALPLIRQHGGWPPTLEIAAIGRATARRLTQAGINQCLQPTADFTSEGLLALLGPEQVAGQAILIVCGEGGRPLLGDVLTERGARVDRATVYRRERPVADTGLLLEHWRCGAIGAVVITSTESLLNLFDMLGKAGQDALQETSLIVLSARTRQTAAELGCRHLLVADEASDEAIIAALLKLAATSSPAQLGNAI
ncbi:MAG: uroporphyrinogen-III synthase [Candidatus Competibacter denitrificans]